MLQISIDAWALRMEDKESIDVGIHGKLISNACFAITKLGMSDR